ncbi:L-Aspartase-like protein [Dactylonectria estremocensis]|uniref:argininosuccinate lyase n=1 Tax=Dactylonectria estremocensis TaxID=1079267 RepID=A0A9P9ITH6_9HYPO|nr:L-Aspartase-like protein [Dactylonectria estremocensis]
MASSSKPEGSMLWGGRFTGGLDPLMVKYNESIYFDRVLYKQDILGSIAFARANAKNGIITQEEFQELEKGLLQVQSEWDNGTFTIISGVDEDIHTANERRLGEIIGKNVAGKLHTGRSRNEQVVCDMRMWLRDELRKIDDQLTSFLKLTAARAESEIDYIMPGYTHLQRAQPVRWSHWMLSYGFAFANDLERLREVIKRINRSPLGCGALAGNPFGIDREMMAEELGFEGILWNSMGAVADRDFVSETLQWGSMLMQHISRWAEDLIIYSTAEFGFIRLADAYSTGSSLMPQKKNADSLELLRGKSGRAFGHMAGLMMTQKGLPSTYNKDLQESLEPMMDHVKTVSDSIQIANGVLSTLTALPEKMKASLDPFMLATDVADYLVRKGVPFRETHHISGRCVAKSEETGIPMNELSYETLKGIDERFEEDIADVFNYEASVESRTAKGGASKAAVLEQIAVIRKILG